MEDKAKIKTAVAFDKYIRWLHVTEQSAPP